MRERVEGFNNDGFNNNGGADSDELASAISVD